MHYIEFILEKVMDFCYAICGNYWLSIAFFTLLTKIILLPLSLWCQMNSIVMVKLMPMINKIMLKHWGDKDMIAEKQHSLFKKEHYHPLLSLVPLAVQVVILMGMVAIIHQITDTGKCDVLGLIPIKDGGWVWLWPFIAGLSAWILGEAQNRINPLQHEQSRFAQESTNWTSIILSVFLGVYVATGVIFYWICSNLLAIPVQIICNWLIPGKKYIDYQTLEETRKELAVLKNLDNQLITPEMKKKEKNDYGRFFSIANKHLVFYSEASGFYKYYQNIIEYLLKHSNVVIHYITNDYKDQIFKLAELNHRIKPYYIGKNKMITLMMKMDADIVVMTTPDLDNFYIKRSYVRKDIEYIYTDHAICSIHLTVREHAYDHFDTFFCIGPNQEEELRATENLYKTSPKKLVQCGYGLLDNLIENYEKNKVALSENGIKKILIAPSWQFSNILDSCLEQLVESLLGHGYQIIVRPHPEYKKRFASKLNAIIKRYEKIPIEKLVIETDFSSNVTIFSADLVITDWSGIAYEFAFSTLKPVLFINTPMKITNPNYEKIGIVPIDISLRNQIGVSLDLEELEKDKIRQTVAELLEHREHYKSKISKVRLSTISHLGHSGEVAGQYIVNQLIAKKSQKKE